MTQLYALVVDDKPDNLKIVGKLLDALNVKVQSTTSGEEAVKLVLSPEPNSQAFDFLVLDIHMPNIGGIEIAKTVRAAGYKGAIFAFTAHATMEAKNRGVDSGINAFLSKATMKKELLAALIAEHVKDRPRPC